MPVQELESNGELIAALTGDYGATERTLRDNLQARTQRSASSVAGGVDARHPGLDPGADADPRLSREGHLAANLDPLGLADRKVHKELKPETYGFTEADLNRPIFIDRVLAETATMRQILRILRRTYCRHIGVQFMHITSPAQKGWIQDRIEGEEKDIRFTPKDAARPFKLIETETSSGSAT